MIELLLGAGAFVLSFSAMGVTIYNREMAKHESRGGISAFEREQDKRIEGYKYQKNGQTVISGEPPTHYTMPTGGVRCVDAKLIPWNNTPVRQDLNTLYKCGECNLYSRRHNQITEYLKLKVDEKKPLDEKGYDFDRMRIRYSEEYRFLRYTQHLQPGALWFIERVCPHCKNMNELHISRDSDDFNWLDDHPDCLKLDDEGLRDVYLLHEGLRETIKDNKSITAFLEYNKLSKNLEEARKVHETTLGQAEKDLKRANSVLNNMGTSDVGGPVTEIKVGGEKFTLRNFPDGLHVMFDYEWIKTTEEEMTQLITQALRKEREQ